MKTITVQIGNSDNKLTQQEWNLFVNEVQETIEKGEVEQHFFGGSPNWYPWQNVAWIFICPDSLEIPLMESVARIGRKFKQDSIAWTVGITKFI